VHRTADSGVEGAHDTYNFERIVLVRYFCAGKGLLDRPGLSCIVTWRDIPGGLGLVDRRIFNC